jgi:hypothetical protein
MKINLNARKSNLFVALVLMAASVIPAITYYQHTSAASLTQVFVRFDRMKISTGTTGTVCAKPATVGTETTVKVTYPAGYSLSSAATFSVDTTNTAWPTGAVAWPSIATATNVTSQDVTFPSGDLTVGTLYCFNWVNVGAVSVKTSASPSNVGSVTTQIAGPATLDTAQYSTASITDDQIAVTATVPQAFSFALSGNTDALGTLSTASVTPSPTPRTATVNTNAKNGWTVWAKDSSTGLTSATASSTIASTTPGTNSTLSNGANGYNTGVTSSQAGGSGAVTVATPFVGGLLGKGGGLDTSLRSLASSTGTADTAVLTLTNNVSIAPTQAAATDYTDTITVIGAGLF